MLQGAIVWAPMIETDSLNEAEKIETLFSDPRIKHYWDPDRILGKMLAQTLHLEISIAWDVYLVYSPDHSWNTGLPPAPKFWMHQLDEKPTLLLDPVRLRQSVKWLLMVSRINNLFSKIIKVPKRKPFND
ncbi:MAG TPA: hypothetical protein VK851_01080 [Anaerolineales bacterium]|nr:hypothetical protein [Anaerolineales bacterium]